MYILLYWLPKLAYLFILFVDMTYTAPTLPVTRKGRRLDRIMCTYMYFLLSMLCFICYMLSLVLIYKVKNTGFTAFGSVV